jgi:pilus assembly protein CpaF
MPVVKSYQKLVHEPLENGAKKFEDIASVITCITNNILKDSPELVMETDGSRPDKRLLQSAIIKDIESNKYNYGIFRDELILRVMEFMSGYGELQQYIEDDDITDIDGMRFNQFSIKRHGFRSKIPVNFGSSKMFDTWCRLIIVRNGGNLNQNESCCRVADEKYRLRISISINPGNITGPALSIRKHRRGSCKLEDLKELGMLDDELMCMFRELAAGEASILFCGKGASGKTTLLRAFIDSLPEMERVFIVEPEAEIFPDKPYCIEQQIKKQKEDGNAVTLKDLVREALVMPMDIYCVGDISGDEASAFVKATSTGYRGFATMHSGSAETALTRLLALSRDASIAESEKTIKEMLGRGINAVIYLKDFKVVEMLEVVGYDIEHDTFDYKRLYPHNDRDAAGGIKTV